MCAPLGYPDASKEAGRATAGAAPDRALAAMAIAARRAREQMTRGRLAGPR